MSAPFGRNEPLLFAIEVQVRFGQRDARDRAQLGVDLEQQLDILFDRNCERIDLVGVVHSAVTAFSGARRISCSLHSRRGARDFDRPRRGGFDRTACQIITTRRIPTRRRRCTRTLMPTDSASEALPTLPFFVESARLR